MSDNLVAPPGYYDDGSGRQRYWDGRTWGEYAAVGASPSPTVDPTTLTYSTPQAPAGGGTPYASVPGSSLDAQPISASATVPASSKSALGIWALVLGIIGVCFALIPHTSGFGIFLGVVALALGIIGAVLKKGSRAIAGTILGGAAFVLGIVFAVVYGVASAGSSVPVADSAAHSSPVATPGRSAAADGATPGTSSAPVKKSSPSKAAAPVGTAAQLQALVAAKSYLADGQGFSQAGLLSQLTSQFGNGFAQADAQWAIDHAGADWNAQAVAAAKNYLSDGQGFSQAGLLQQLTSSSGNKFVPSQAQYGIDHSGADWNAQAVMAAKNYMATGMGYSRDSLIQQMTSTYGSQFTEAQAEYAASQVGL
ncbi:Ltp family lipoprotein [Humibacter ginsenosidimutans]|uniref:Putative host cell surface-exposed lipoprotein Ltp-like HTH region domain-containing protein n=1 Tax=Humibacter ginsenosidimutans TaxID=2599293 RepID=A0A5B8M4Z6_9MICO|nr:Ltp family lipoprotein [Humibacter ginsenosidimutans]QDZ15099.1 hypothetical protein FPZ11_10230 [Humibacter ginsenosidimutans]